MVQLKYTAASAFFESPFTNNLYKSKQFPFFEWALGLVLISPVITSGQRVKEKNARLVIGQVCNLEGKNAYGTSV